LVHLGPEALGMGLGFGSGKGREKKACLEWKTRRWDAERAV
jgi:hypothetical protein